MAKKKKIPDYRIIAIANLDLEEHMTDHPLKIAGPQKVRWDVEETEYHYIAKGTIHIPIEMYFSKPDDPDDTPEKRRVLIGGKRRFDARLGEIDIDDEAADMQGKDYGIDEDAARAQSFVRYHRSMKGSDKQHRL